jgi:metal-dependent amidase/aminoacylase/carboxypeptidase family protein
VHRGLGGTGVVGALKGNGARTIGLRADMDALAMLETADRPHRSTAPVIKSD